MCVCVFFTLGQFCSSTVCVCVLQIRLVNPASTVPTNIQGCQYDTWSARQENNNIYKETSNETMKTKQGKIRRKERKMRTQGNH